MKKLLILAAAVLLSTPALATTTYTIFGLHDGTSLQAGDGIEISRAGNGSYHVTGTELFNSVYANAPGTTGQIAFNSGGALSTADATTIRGLLGLVPLASSGLYSDLSGTPTALSAFTNDSGYITGINSAAVTAALGFTPQNAATAFNGAYTSLTGKPTIPTLTSQLTNDAGFITGINSAAVTTALGYTPQNAATSFNGSFNALAGKPSTISGYGITDALAQPLASFTANAGTITGSDTILTAIQKNAGNLAAYVPSLATTTGTLPIASGGTGVTSPGSVGKALVSGAGPSSSAALIWATPSINSYSNQIALGDSITCGTGAAGTSSCSNLGYANIVAAAGGMTLTNSSNQGDQVADQSINYVVNAQNPSISGNVLYTDMIGTNDVTFYGLGDQENYVYRPVHQAVLSWLTVPQEFKTFANTCTQTGTWAASATWVSSVGEKSTTNGSTLSCPITSYGAPVYFWYIIHDGDGGTFTYSVDGGTPFTVTTAANNASGTAVTISTHHSITATASYARITGLSAGSHTVLFTVTSATSASNAVNIGAVGTPPPNRYWRGPVVFSAGVPYQQGDMNSTITAGYNTAAQADADLMMSDGLNVHYVDVRRYWGSNASLFYQDGLNVHPNLAGHQLLAQAFEAVAQFPSGPGATTSTLGSSISATSPAKSNDVTTGLYSGASGEVDTSCSGVECMSITNRFLSTYCSNTASCGIGVAASTGHSYTWTATGSASSNGHGGFTLVDNTESSQPFYVYGGSATGGTGSLVGVAANATLGFNPTSGSSMVNTTMDTGMSRMAAGTIGFGTGVNGNTNGVVVAAAFASGGTKFTASGCSVGTLTGGATAGTALLGANSCTLIVTTGVTATNGWTCQAHDRTTPTALIGGESSSTSTTASFSIPSGAGSTDIISFSCRAY